MKRSLKTAIITELETTIDKVTTENWDLTDRIKRLEMELENSRNQNKGLNEIQQRQQAGYNDDLFRAQRNVAASEKEQQRIQQNYDHAQQTIRQLNATVEAAKKEVEKFRNAHIAEEHFARKLVELCTVNDKLRAEIVTLKEQERAACEIMTKKLEEIPEFKKYQEQVTRLLNERLKYNCQEALTSVGKPVDKCGECLSCQLKQSKALYDISISHEKETRKMMQQLSDKFEHLKNIHRYLLVAINKITGAWPWEYKSIANGALADRLNYMKINNLDSDNAS